MTSARARRVASPSWGPQGCGRGSPHLVRIPSLHPFEQQSARAVQDAGVQLLGGLAAFADLSELRSVARSQILLHAVEHTGEPLGGVGPSEQDAEELAEHGLSPFFGPLPARGGG